MSNDAELNTRARDTADLIKKNAKPEDISKRLGEDLSACNNAAEAKKYLQTLDKMNASDQASSRKYLPDVQIIDGRSTYEYVTGGEEKPGAKVKWPSPMGDLYNAVQTVDPVANGKDTSKNLETARQGK